MLVMWGLPLPSAKIGDAPAADAATRRPLWPARIIGPRALKRSPFQVGELTPGLARPPCALPAGRDKLLAALPAGLARPEVKRAGLVISELSRPPKLARLAPQMVPSRVDAGAALASARQCGRASSLPRASEDAKPAARPRVVPLDAPAAAPCLEPMVSTAVVSVAAREESDKLRLASWWAEATSPLGQEHCKELAGLQSSSDAHRGLIAIFATSAPRTLARYRGGWASWAEFAVASGVHSAAPPAGLLMDFLFCIAEGSRRSQASRVLSSVSSVVSALRFVGGKLGAAKLLEACDANCVRAVVSGKRSCRPPKEAVPLTLRAVILLELAMSTTEDLQTRLLLGALLFAIWGGLRFSDVQRCAPGEMQCCDGVLYAWVWRSKSSRSGFPVAVACGGFTGSAWTDVWLQALSSWQQSLPAGASPDFLVPARTGGSMAYSSMLAGLRLVAQKHLQLSPQDSRDLTLHSLKRTLAAFSAQSGFPEEWCRSHCRHAPRSGNTCTPKYRMDDTVGGLRLQLGMRLLAHGGWIPRTAVRRGGSPPVEQPAVAEFALPRPGEDLLSRVFPSYPSICLTYDVDGARASGSCAEPKRPPAPPPLPGNFPPPLPASAPAVRAGVALSDDGEISSDDEQATAPSHQPAPPPGPDCDVSSGSDAECSAEEEEEEAGASSIPEVIVADGDLRFLVNHKELTVHVATACDATAPGVLCLDGASFARRCRPSAALAAGTWEVLEDDPGSCYASCGHEACRSRLDALRLYL